MLFRSVGRHQQNAGKADLRPLGPRARARPPSRPTPFSRRLAGLRVLPYLDDFLFLVQGEKEALRARDFVDATLARLGLHRNPKKGQWEPAQSLEHLGIAIDSKRGMFLLTPKRLQKLRSGAHDLLCRGQRDKGWIPAKNLASFLGLAQSASLAVAPARFFSRALYDVLNTASSWASKVHLSSKGQAWRDLHWWCDLHRQEQWLGRAIWQEPVAAVLYTDASSYGWGGRLMAPQEVPARGFWSPDERLTHITFKELRAVRYSITALIRFLHDRRVLLYTDNTAVWRVVQASVSKSPALMSELRELWYLLDSSNISLDTRWLKSADNLADALSRVRDPSACQLRPALFRRLDALWGPHDVDRFASATDTLLPRFNSLFLDHRSEGVNALAQSWAGTLSWVHPPWQDLPAVVYFLRSTGAAATVLAPWWPSAHWFPDLMALASDHLLLPLSGSLLRDGRPWVPPAGLPSAPLVVFRVLGGRPTPLPPLRPRRPRRC